MKPMMAQAIEHVKIDTKCAGYVMEPKLDGMRLMLHFPSGKLSGAFTRSGRDVLPQVPVAWVEWCEPLIYEFWWLTGYEWWDCEFGYGSAAAMDFNKTMRIMGSGADEAQRKADELEEMPLAAVFDVPDQGGQLWERRETLETFETHLDDHDLGTNKGFALIPQLPEFRESYYTWICATAHGEGVMLKNPKSEYIPGKRRANTWYKVKKFDTLEMFVVGADPGQGKYEGLIGALVLETTDGLQLRASGMTDDERLRMTARLDRIVREKRVVEVKYFGLTAGTPRHPQFLRWREDRNWSECSWASQKSK